MGDDELKNFKIGANHRQGMSAPKTPVQKVGEEPADNVSLGFTRIESLLENEDPTKVGENLSHILESLGALKDESGTNRDKSQAQKAIGAVERAVDMLDYLYQVKAELEDDPASS